MTDFKRHQEAVARAAFDAHMIESLKTQEIVLSSRALRQQQRDADRRAQLLNTLSTLDYHNQHRTLQRERVEGTGSWFTEHETFRRWIDDPNQAHFACYGIPGSGKTMLASTVVDKMSLFYTSHKSALCYHYCDYKRPQSLQTATIFGTLTRQLLDRIEIPLAVGDMIQARSSAGSTTIVAEDMYEVWQASLRSFSQVFIVIDGLDELDTAAQARFLKNLLREHSATNVVPKILVFSRNEELAIRKMFREASTLSISSECVSKDLRTFAKSLLDQEAGPDHVISHDTEVKQAVLDDICSGAADM